MKLSYNAAALAILVSYGQAQFTWPSAYDELEDVMFLNTGYKARGFSVPITPCSFSANGPGRQTAAEWLRAGFHDMSTTNVFFAPHGGIDASLAFELNDGEYWVGVCLNIYDIWGVLQQSITGFRSRGPRRVRFCAILRRTDHTNARWKSGRHGRRPNGSPTTAEWSWDILKSVSADGI